MTFSTPSKLFPYFHAAMNTNAGVGEELIGMNIWKFYVGIYFNPNGFDISFSILELS